MALLSIKGPGEVIPLEFDYCAVVGSGVITSAACTVVLTAGASGQDLAAMLIGDPVFTDSHVTQKLGGGLVGNVYRVKCTVNTDDGNTFELSGDVPVNTVFGT